MDEKKEEAKPEDKKEVEGKTEATPSEETGAEKVINDSKEIVAGMKKENDRKEKLVDREEKLQAKKESLDALGGGSPAGTESPKPNFTDEEKASRKRIKAVGDASGAAWADKYE